MLSVNGGVVLQIGNQIEVLRDDGLPTRVIFPSVPAKLLAVASKIAALYVQHFDAAETLAAAGDVETLTVGLSQKTWQKISILNRLMAPQAHWLFRFALVST